MIEGFLARDEGKTLEFKENCRPLERIVRTAVAFANTAGGTIVIGVKDKTKAVVGIADPLVDEERLANAFADGIRPLLVPDVQIHAWRKRQRIVVIVSHAVGPFYVRSEGAESGVYVRLGSTNRPAGPELLAELQRLARNTFFDEEPCSETSSDDIDVRAASELFAGVSRPLTPPKQRSLGLVVGQGARELPSIGAVLLFGKTRGRLFPSATIRCARFLGKDTAKFLDQTEIDEHLPKAVESAVAFIERHTRQGIEIGRVRRRDVPEYPVEAVREAVINAVVHADYSIGGAGTKIAVFDDRIEITNPGLLPFGLTLEAALAGVSRLRNRVIGRTFRELGLIEQWGSGLGRITAACVNAGLPAPRFEELGANFRVTLSGERVTAPTQPEWQSDLLAYLAKEDRITTQRAAGLWNTSARTARNRLLAMVKDGLVAEVGRGPTDPYRMYVLKGGRNG
ncbi:MAG: putative DNA binding domain-containing protein [Planctomycetes bacterium]|nr:putative DNA binding domain-containing protein [Planctomycetota bacterium]